METLAKPQEYQNPCLISSPDSHSSNSSSCSNSSNHQQPTPPTTPTPTTPPPIPITRSEPNNPYPTTFVQAEPSSFKQVVQMLTGSAKVAGRVEPVRNPIPPIKTGPKKDKSSSKLYERRNSMKNFKISPLGPGLVDKSLFSGLVDKSLFSPRTEILSPSILDFPALALSPVTPLIHDPFMRSPNLDLEAEDKAIAKKGFFFHPSPSRESEPPRLLPLFPVTSPRVSGHGRRCWCDVAALSLISGSRANPGRRYYKCSTGGCNYFSWGDEAPMAEIDPEMDEVFVERKMRRKHTVGEELVLHKNLDAVRTRSFDLQERVQKLEENQFRQWIVIVLLVGCFLGCLAATMMK